MTEFNEWYTKETHDLILECLYIKSDGVRDPEDNRREYSFEEKLTRCISDSLEVIQKFRDEFSTPSIYKAGDIHFLVDVLDESYMDNKYPMLVVKSTFENWGNDPLLIVLLHKNNGMRLIVTANDKALNYINCSNIGNSLGKTLDIKMKGNKKMCQGGRSA